MGSKMPSLRKAEAVQWAPWPCGSLGSPGPESVTPPLCVYTQLPPPCVSVDLHVYDLRLHIVIMIY